MRKHVGAVSRTCASILVALAALAVATPARAQGMYLQEIEKDGRIYVFNIKANAERFQVSGEMGVGITMLGAGPNGETVIGDNEKALQLYFFKHNIPIAVADPAPPPPAPVPYKFSGLVFGDYYHMDSHASNFDQQHGFWVRRVYFTYDHTFSPKISTRVRFEANSNGKMQGGSLTPYVKDLYLKWNFAGRQALTLGIHPSLTFDFIEGFWGLRHIEKTPMDLYKWDSSRDTGVTMAGPLNAAGTVKYSLQYGNESGNNAETDKFKAVRVEVRYETNPGFSVQGLFNHFSRANNADRQTSQIFLGYRGASGRVGFQYSFQKRKAANGVGSDTDLHVISGFGVYDIKKQKYSLFARVDRYDDPCPDCSGIDYLPIDTKEPFTLTIVGLEYYIHPSVRFSPNVEYVAYGNPDVGSKPKDDTAARLTFYWVW